MKKLLLILLCFPMIGFGQTNVPDSAFEAFLEINGYGNGIANDSIVSTVMISYATILNVSNYSISNLKGIEDFVILESLDCSNNQLTNLNVSQNLTLTILNCSSNQLTSLDVRNGNNMNMAFFNTTNNPNLTCINVDDVAYSTTSWTDIDPQHYFSNNCSGTAIQEYTTNKEILKVADLLGRETKQTNQPLFYIYDDGTVEKRIVIE